MAEIMEPSDLVVRCEFSRDGMVVPEGARYMGKDLDFCLDVFDYRSYAVEEVTQQFRIGSSDQHPPEGAILKLLVGSSHTDAFNCFLLNHGSSVTLDYPESLAFVVQTKGASIIRCDDSTVSLKVGESAFVAAKAGDWWVTSVNSESEFLFLLPGWVDPSEVVLCNHVES